MPDITFGKDLPESNEKSKIKLFDESFTFFEEIFACGDVTDVFAKRIVIASGEGAKAVLCAKQYLSKKKNESARSI